jgi:hypothetical protein
MLITRSRLHWDVDVVRYRELDSTRVTRIGVAENAHAGIAGENTL